MEIIKILGIDPSLRSTGIAIVSFDTQKLPSDPEAFKVSNCQVLVNPASFKGKDAIWNMIDLLQKEAKKDIYQDIDNVIVEAPPAIFNSKFPSSTLAIMGIVCGAAISAFDLEKTFMFYPAEWNKSRKKDVTHTKTEAFLGSTENWHFEKRIKSEKLIEHVLDAASLALWWIKQNYVDDEAELNGVA